jgi:hypothetical protein
MKMKLIDKTTEKSKITKILKENTVRIDFKNNIQVKIFRFNNNNNTFFIYSSYSITSCIGLSSIAATYYGFNTDLHNIMKIMRAKVKMMIKAA